ncbi:hypothetical protein [Methylobacterium dankookense]|uniref:Uncharacterized protein n=1 Tax=Methylobacterium dankookense TaxID=560405 RepID=A0A564FX07_9HYPH|nr:hypothetical protein [Methylobacterium dankookense]GJD56764.1 hypothetical protein IFDJLNFL_2661 [Methylobacterium dankookense]VUF12394.1 hypothetical protein MTDSW087_02084 [Methylobacterium dankookense]
MRRFHPGPARSPLAPALLAALAWMLASPSPAAAQGYRPVRPCGPPPCRPLPPPGPGYYGPPALIRGYLPRPHTLPMYNEPPARPPAY